MSIKKLNEEQIIQLLQAEKKPLVGDTEMQKVQAQVWQKLSINISNMSQNNKSNSKFWQKVFPSNFSQVFFKSPILWGSTASFVLLVTVVSVTVYNNPNSNKFFSKDVAKSSQSSSQSQDLKTLASNRIKELTGFSGEDYTKLQETIKNATSVKANAQEAYRKELSSLNIKNMNSKIYYVETEEVSFDIPENNGLRLPSSSVPSGQKTISKQWSLGFMYGKYTSESGGKFLNKFVSTPDYSYTYLGGKYAIKEINSETIPETSYGGESALTGELNFLESLVNTGSAYGQNYTKKGEIQENGKTLYVFESNTDDQSTSKQVYFIDKNNLSMEKVQYIMEGKVLSETKKIKSELIDPSQKEAIFNYDEQKNVPVKEFIRDTKTITPSKTQYSDFVSRHPILYNTTTVLDENSIMLQQTRYYTESDNNKDLVKAYQDVDFNPDVSSYVFDDQSNPDYWQNVIGSYGSNSTNVSISKARLKNQPSTIFVSSKSTKVNVEGQQIIADIENVKVIDGDPDKNKENLGCFVENWEVKCEKNVDKKAITYVEYQELVFEYKGFWYRLTFFDNKNIESDLNNLTFKSLTTKEAQKLDDSVNAVTDQNV